MLIQINAEEVASKLALADTVSFFRGIKAMITQKDIEKCIDGTILSSSLKEYFIADIQYYYQKQHDYYFKFLTNLQKT